MDREYIDLGAGAFIIIALISLAFIALRAANVDTLGAASTYELRIYFQNIGGLVTRSPVKSSGIIVGRVAALDLDHDTYEAVARLEIETKYQFPDDSSFSVVSTNLLGSQYVNIEAGGSADMLGDGDETEGNSALILEDLISKFLFDKAAE